MAFGGLIPAFMTDSVFMGAILVPDDTRKTVKVIQSKRQG
jgi:hypothetical protein